MASLLLFRLCLLSLTTDGLWSFDHLMMFAIVGGDATLPCDIPSINRCSSVNWSMAEQFGSVTEVAMVPNIRRIGLLKDYSLVINHLELNDARRYSCHSGEFRATVSLQILKLVESLIPAEGTIELQCFLNTYVGLAPCKNRGIHIKWSTGDNAPLLGNRFNIKNPSDCFSKLIINKKLTDHHRKWKCQLFQNDTVKATISYTTTVKDGIEEVFAAVGESVSLSCSDTSSLGADGSVEWALGGRTPTDDFSPYNGQTGAFHVNKDSSLFISKVSAVHAGDYQCSESSGQQKVLNKIRLHILDVTSEYGPGEDNVTLTCVLTCTKQCDKDLNLTWSGSNHNSWQSSLLSVNNTLRKKLFLPVLSMTSEELTCLVHREGVFMVSKKWCTVNSLLTPAWLALPLGLLICITAPGLHMYMKKKQDRHAGNEQSSIGMTPVYDVIQDA